MTRRLSSSTRSHTEDSIFLRPDEDPVWLDEPTKNEKLGDGAPKKDGLPGCQDGPAGSPNQQGEEVLGHKLFTLVIEIYCWAVLFIASQVMGYWVFFVLEGNGPLSSIYKALQVIDFYLSFVLPCQTIFGTDSKLLMKELENTSQHNWIVRGTAGIGVTICAVMVINIVCKWHYGTDLWSSESITRDIGDRRQSVSRQPSFTLSEWTDAQEDLLDLDPIPQTPVFDLGTDTKMEADASTLTVTPVGLQERRGSNVSLTLDMCTPGCTEPYGYGAQLSPRDQSAQEYLRQGTHVLTPAMLHTRAMDDQNLQAEFYETPMNFVDPKEYNYPGLVRKNRYKTILPNTHSRVILKSQDEDDFLSTYINANYLKGYGDEENAYIATQGPTVNTVGDFWRMVWEQRTCTIVMMTHLEEKSRIKCEQYWPSRGTETYGMIQVTILDTVELATYVMRTFTFYKNGSSEKREVLQFQFLGWPDHGVPEYPTTTLAFLQKVRACNPPDAGPIIVHCSAGVGRTGCFIVIDAMLERMKHEKSVDIYGHVTCMRAQRNYMVQTEDQYIFIHEALLEAATCGCTEVTTRNLYTHIQKLNQSAAGETLTPMAQEFKKLTSTANFKAQNMRFISANLPCNKFKNRLINILPFEFTRVCLKPIRGVEGSDYINASFINGYRHQGAYIATQGPLAETSEDFWRMLWEHNSTIVVMLTKLREMGREKCHQYWPAECSARYQYFVVDPMAEYNMPQYILREFKVTDARDGQSRTIRQFQFTDWPEQGVPKTGEAFIDFIGQVHKTKEQFGQDGPITVHCSAGVGRTGVFITLSIVLERMRHEGVVDVFQTVKILRTQRPAMVQTEDQYQLCYRAALEYLGSFDHYAT
uniref:protein-tyrosine-phosphatase n=1 Tax=Nothobranchius furzeri TaxID=105023 RepID=A0A1A8V549_NOTFU